MAAVLVIDDDPLTRLFLSRLLKKAGHNVQEAKDGREGLRALEDERFDLILCDMFMPEKDGLEVIREIRRRRLGARVLAMSAGGCDGRLDVLPMAQRLGAAILRKPFSARAVLSLALGILATEKEAPSTALAV